MVPNGDVENVLSSRQFTVLQVDGCDDGKVASIEARITYPLTTQPRRCCQRQLFFYQSQMMRSFRKVKHIFNDRDELVERHRTHRELLHLFYHP